MSIPKINSLSIPEINSAMRQVVKVAEIMVATSKADLKGLSKIVHGPPGPSGKRGEVGPIGPEPDDGPDLTLLFNNGLI